MPLCTTCNQFFRTQVFDFRVADVTVDDYPHHFSILEFLKAVDQKCFICWWAFHHSFSNPAQARGHLERIARVTSSPRRVTERAWLSPDRRCVTHISGGRRRMWPKFNEECLHGINISHNNLSELLLPDIETVERLLQLKGQDDNGRAAGSVIALLREPAVSDINVQSLSTGSDETFMKISTWIRRCELEHPRCARFKDSTPWYPTRLIDVGSQGNVSVVLVRGGQAIAKDQEYMTLSHRWGSSNVPMLTSETIVTWTKVFSLRILPKPFCEFIMLAQRLKIRYVWIDSLCIIQQGDGGEDWRIEALTMDQVYKNSYCNISTDWGSAKRGLYYQRDLRFMDKPKIDWIVKRDPNPDVVTVEECLLVENEFWEDQVSKSPLSTRGWVVQERRLSPRNIHFGSREVFFECNQYTFCERFSEKLPEVLQEGDVILKAAFGRLQILQNPSIAPGPVTPGTELYMAWGDILSKYSRCYLTFASDRLVAFTGVAKFLKSLVDDGYVAGLWLRNLASNMMWFRNRLLTTAVIEKSKDRLRLFEHDQASQYRAPSFSWASAALPIELNDTKDNVGFLVAVKCIKFRDTSNALIEEWTDDLYSPLLNPEIEIQVVGYLKKWRLKSYSDGEETYLYVILDGPGEGSKTFGDWSNATLKEITEATLDFQLDSADIAAWAVKDSLYYMLWQDCLKSSSPAHSKREDDFVTMLLFEIVDPHMSRFRRIGRLYIHSKAQRKLYIGKQESESTLPCAHFDPKTRRHTIYVI